MRQPFSTDEAFALRMDEQDSLRAWREEFEFPSALRRSDGRDAVYMAGNSLGLMPKAARAAVEQELDDWARLGVEAHFHSKHPWFSYHEVFRDTGARLVGAKPGEVVMMNSLTVNLHLMMVSFYRPTPARHKIVIEDAAFPSDSHAVNSQIRFHRFEPATSLIRLKPREGEQAIREEDIESLLVREGASVALLMLPGVNYFTGQLFDMARITAAGKQSGCIVGLDLAHSVGNAVHELHDWDVDFAVWCSYKYLNACAGAPGGCFVHEKHSKGAAKMPRFEGWWGHDPKTRFKMGPVFEAAPGADAWQVSNPPILSMAPLKASLEIFDRAGMRNLREKSVRLSAYLERLLEATLADKVNVITPRETERRGCQLSLVVQGADRSLVDRLKREGVVCDFREPNVIRMAPTPLYNSFRDCWEAVGALKRCVG